MVNIEPQQTNLKPSVALTKKELIAIIFCLVIVFPALLAGTFSLINYYSGIMAKIQTTNTVQSTPSQKNARENVSAATLWRLRSCAAKFRRRDEPQVALNDK
ncbi:hypothetical protein PN36_28805 [Candidatus Thiomargarita nelsonii]|uniref:Uncharacterized protein n=1 Tax=Candidatus Thiomargarita nelsonii TaxID=1003181 RepID=A0A0A6P4U7_9GAMM|nr:hypothetical protein PN36_28805 [Candidatus Thiomargarita nelsonii]